jgi:hypothetical protein
VTSGLSLIPNEGDEISEHPLESRNAGMVLHKMVVGLCGPQKLLNGVFADHRPVPHGDRSIHARVVPLFLFPDQTFLNGLDLKEDLKNLDQYYLRLPDEIQRQGLMTYARTPPEDASFLTTRLWGKYLPDWRDKSKRVDINDPHLREPLVQLMSKVKEVEQSGIPHDETNLENIDHLTIRRQVATRKGRYRRFTEEVERESLEENR